MKTWLKRIALFLLVVFAGAQVVRPDRSTPPTDPSQTIFARAQVAPKAERILRRACRDCHSHDTSWPWYTNVAPVSWWIADHVRHGRSHMNYSEWGKLTPKQSGILLDEMCGEVTKRAMPLPVYLPLHGHARMNDEDIKDFCAWTEEERKRLAGPATAAESAAPATQPAPSKKNP